MTPEKKSYIVLFLLTSVSAYLLSIPYFSDQYGGNNSMAGLAYMMIAPILAIIATLIIIAINFVLIKLLKLPKIKLSIVLIFSLVVNFAAANIWLILLVIFAPLQHKQIVESDKYKNENIVINVESLNIIKQDHKIFPANVVYTLKVTNSGEKEVSYSTIIEFGYYINNEQTTKTSSLANDIIELNLPPGETIVTHEALVGAYAIRCALDSEKNSGGKFSLKYRFEGPGDYGDHYIQLSDSNFYTPLKDVQRSLGVGDRPCIN